MTAIAAPWLTQPETRAVMAALDGARAGSARFVGGCVRNTLLGAPVDDIDIATQLVPEQVIAAAKAAGFAAHPTGIEHGTVTLVCNHVPFEVTTLRRDVSTDGRRATVAFTEDWSEDAQRRDFHLNALYAAPDGTVFDPTGEGLSDAAARRVVFIGDPALRIREDYLRILRFFRFHAWYGRGPLDDAGLAACAALSKDLATLSAERVWKELKKTLGARDPRIALEGLERSGAWAVAAPEARRTDRLRRMIAIEDGFALEGDPLRRLAAALPDEASGAALARRLKLSTDEAVRLKAALGDTPRLASYLSPREVRRAVYRIGGTAFEDRARIAWAEDPNGKTGVQWRALLALGAAWTPPKLPLSGEEVMAAGVPAGPKVGQVLREVEAWWMDADFPDDKLAVVERLKSVAEALG